MPVPRRYTTDAIVLSRFDLGEADRVLTLITPTAGKLKAIAKGVRRTTSRLGGSLEPFAELTVALARGRTFDVVTQVSVGHAWLRLRDDLEHPQRTVHRSQARHLFILRETGREQGLVTVPP